MWRQSALEYGSTSSMTTLPMDWNQEMNQDHLGDGDVRDDEFGHLHHLGVGLDPLDEMAIVLADYVELSKGKERQSGARKSR